VILYSTVKRCHKSWRVEASFREGFRAWLIIIGEKDTNFFINEVSVVKRLFKTIPFFSFPATILLLHIIAVKVFDLYAIYPHLDILAHFLGGVSIAYTAYLVIRFVQIERVIAKLDKPIITLLVITTTATTSVLWEFAEFLLDYFFHTDLQISLANTMQDQFFGVLGGLCLVILLRSKADEQL
jgi:hypothetical protein